LKPERAAFRPLQREQRLGQQPHDDSYRDEAKLPDPARCPKCGAAYRKGRWTWTKAPAGATAHKCPACRRAEDDFPAGYVKLNGAFLAEHRAEILNLVKACEARAKSEHPMQRIIAVKGTPEGVLVTTTDVHLAHGIAEAVHAAFKGELDLKFSRADNLLRAAWTR
jgi:NMD protein affecting ribosome stability and mRNA decay